MFHNVIDETHRTLLFLIFYFQGEPYIHPFFLKLVRYAHLKGIYTITSTNGHFLSPENCQQTIESGLDRLIISVDGTTQETYSMYRKSGNLETVLQGAKNMVEAKKNLKSNTPEIVFQFLVLKHNEHQIRDIYRISREIGVDSVSLKTAQIYDFRDGSDLMPENPRFNRYRQIKDGSYIIKNPLKNSCWKLWHASVITWDGRVVPCCFDKDAKYEMGQVGQKSFEKIWKSARYNKFRRKLVRGRKNIDICQNCTEGTLTGDDSLG